MAVDAPIPSDRQAERAVVASLLDDNGAVPLVAAMLRTEDFEDLACRRIYGTVLDLYAQRVPVDAVLVAGKMGIDLKELFRVLETASYSGHVEYYARRVLSMSRRRALIQVGGRIAGMGYDTDSDFDDLMTKAQAELYAVAGRREKGSYSGMDEMMGEFLDRWEMLQQTPGALTGVPTGFPSLDEKTGGLQRSDLVVLAARTGVGKTAISVNIARNATRAGFRAGVMSLEMPKIQISTRLVAMESDVDQHKLRHGKYVTDEEAARVQDAAGLLSSAPVYVDDKSGLSFSELRSRAHRMVSEQRLSLLVVDYLQKIHTGRRDGNRVQEVSEVARGLKDLGRELNIPILACAQLSRDVEKRGENAVPVLSDLRDSGEIEQEADIVIMVHREDMSKKVSTRPNISDLYIRKHRNGPLGVVSLFFDKKTTRFEELSWREGDD